MAPKSSDSEELSDIAESSDNYQVPSGDEQVVPDQSESVVEEMTDETPPNKPTHPIITFLLKTLKIMLLPFCKVFFAPAAQKAFVKTSVLMVTISWILVTSLVAYILFYNKYVPPITHVQPVWFNYGQHIAPQSPSAVVSIGAMPLRHEQVYDVSVQLHVPTSDVNFAIGNFMINLELQTQNGSTLLQSNRPGILRYQSQTQRIMRVFAKALPLLVGLTEESQVITIKLVDEFLELKPRAANRALISISDPRIQIYDAKLMILANFKGLRYYMYYHSITTACIFIFLFASIEFIFATIAWKGFGEELWHKLSLLMYEANPPPTASIEEADEISEDKSE